MSRYSLFLERRMETGHRRDLRRRTSVGTSMPSQPRASPPARGSPSVSTSVNKWYGAFHVLRDVSLTIRRGERVVVCGPSGSGKSTMIRCINALEEHQEGRIVVDGIELTRDVRTVERIRREVGMVFQQFNLFPHLTVLENLTLAPIWVKRVPKKRGDRHGHGATWSASTSPSRRTSIRASSPAASSSASPSPARCA